MCRNSEPQIPSFLLQFIYKQFIVCSCANIIPELKSLSLVNSPVQFLYRQEAFFFIFTLQGQRNQFLYPLISQALFPTVIVCPCYSMNSPFWTWWYNTAGKAWQYPALVFSRFLLFWEAFSACLGKECVCFCFFFSLFKYRDATLKAQPFTE